MDIIKIKEVILSEINNRSGLYSLQIQNHIYGCFLIMEDIAQNVVTISDQTLIINNKELHLENNFSEIGIYYGFIMDERLLLESFGSDYKMMWIDCFKTVDLTHDIDIVDQIEDVIIQMLTEKIDKKDAFFINALETGSLNDEWITIVLKLLSKDASQETDISHQYTNTENTEIITNNSSDDLISLSENNSQISAAGREKVIKSHHKKNKGLHKTRRNYIATSQNVQQLQRDIIHKKKILILTRRNNNKK
jgi:hypothetical protein